MEAEQAQFLMTKQHLFFTEKLVHQEKLLVSSYKANTEIYCPQRHFQLLMNAFWLFPCLKSELRNT